MAVLSSATCAAHTKIPDHTICPNRSGPGLFPEEASSHDETTAQVDHAMSGM